MRKRGNRTVEVWENGSPTVRNNRTLRARGRNLRVPVSALAVFAAVWVFPGASHGRKPLENAPHYLWFDLDSRIGVGTDLARHAGGAHYAASFRAGVTVVAPYWIITAGGLFRMADFKPDRSRLGAGIQVEAAHFESGLVMYAGPYANLGGTCGFVFGLGWSIFSVETDVFASDRGFRARWFVALRIPLSLGAFVLWERRHFRKRKT